MDARSARSGLRADLSAVVLALAAALSAISLAPTVAGAAVEPTEPLRSEGRWVVDDSGRVVMLRGVNVVAKGPPELAIDRGFDADDIEFLAANGFNVVRLGVDYSSIEPERGVYDEDFIDAYIDQLPSLSEAGIFSLLDLHQDQFSNKYSGNGLPDWMGIDDGLPNTGEGFPMGYLQNPALNRAFDNFWANRDAGDGLGLQDHYAEGLRRIAARAEGEAGVLGYDLFNEPWPGSVYASCAQPGGCPAFDAGQLSAFSERAIAGVRAADQRHMVWIEPNLIYDFGAVSHHLPSSDPNTGWSFHNYCLPGSLPQFPPETTPACEAEEQLPFVNAEARAALTGEALLLTEFGASDDPSVQARITELADEFMVGWTAWTYANYLPNRQFPNQSLVLDTTQPPTGANVNTPVLKELATPYPRVVSGTPTGWSFDEETLGFEAEWETSLPDGTPAPQGRSEVFVPDLHYDGDYSVTVIGAEVIGGIGTQWLEIRNCPEAEAVTLTIAAGAGALPDTCPEQPQPPDPDPGDGGGGGDGGGDGGSGGSGDGGSDGSGGSDGGGGSGGGDGSGGGGGGPADPPAPGGVQIECPRGNSPTVVCAETTLADGTEVLQVVGTTADEVLVGTEGRDIIVCGSGGDRARGRDGRDRIRCGPGDDRLGGGGARDELFGGPGRDLARGSKGLDRIFGGPGRDTLRGGAAADLLRAAAGGGRMHGGGAADRIVGGSGVDRIDGGGGPDLIRVHKGRRDKVDCGGGRDKVRADRRDRLRRCE